MPSQLTQEVQFQQDPSLGHQVPSLAPQREQRNDDRNQPECGCNDLSPVHHRVGQIPRHEDKLPERLAVEAPTPDATRGGAAVYRAGVKFRVCSGCSGFSVYAVEHPMHGNPYCQQRQAEAFTASP
jgi:hypothetical protein